MNRKLTFPELAELLSLATNTSKRLSELMLRELFAVIAERLIEGESVKIDGLGVFGVSKVGARRSVNVNTGEAIEIPGHNKVSFTPDKRLAEVVNAAFASFEAVVLDDDVTTDMLDSVEQQEESALANDADVVAEPEQVTTPSEPEAEPASEELVAETVSEKPEAEPALEEPEAEPVSEEPEAEPVPEREEELPALEEREEAPSDKSDGTANADDTINSDDDEANPSEVVEPQVEANNIVINSSTNDDGDYYYDDEVSWWHRHGAVKGFILGVVCGVVGVYLVNFLIDYMRGGFNPKPAEVYVEESELVVAADTVVLQNDSTILIDDEPSNSVNNTADKSLENAKVVTDTVTGSYFLTRMARKHYGNGHFWVYIYEENKNVISNPNNVKPGTVVVVPDAKKYGIDKDDKQSVEAAKKKEGEILSKYQ